MAAYLVLASPKSQILKSQEALTRRLLGLRSRCKTLAVCTYFNPFMICIAQECHRARHTMLVGARSSLRLTPSPQNSMQQCKTHLIHEKLEVIVC